VIIATFLVKKSCEYKLYVRWTREIVYFIYLSETDQTKNCSVALLHGKIFKITHTVINLNNIGLSWTYYISKKASGSAIVQFRTKSCFTNPK
jgi:hypothetical protein